MISPLLMSSRAQEAFRNQTGSAAAVALLCRTKYTIGEDQIPRGVRRFRHVGRVFFHHQRAVLKLQHRQRHGTLGGVILPLGEHAAEDVYRHHILMASDGESVIGRGARRASLGVAAHGGINFAVPRGVVQIIPDQLGLTAVA